MDCSIARALEQVGSWWSLLIIRDAFTGATRFSHFEKSLGIAKNTLASRLRELVAVGILERLPGTSGSAFDEYHLTERGRDLAPVLITLQQWGDRWTPQENGPAAEIIQADSGEPISQVWPRRASGEPLPLEEMTFRRAPGRGPLNWSELEDD